MKFTIDTLRKTITFHGSFHYSEYDTFRSILPAKWREGFSLLVPIENIDAVLYEPGEPKQIEQPPYPVKYDPREVDCCGGDGPSCACRNEDC